MMQKFWSMATTKPVNKVVVFDLDDTLYKECEYQQSGFSEVCVKLESAFGVSLEDKMAEWQLAKSPDLFGDLCVFLGLPSSTKESLLWLYRLHEPKIELNPSVRKLLQILGQTCRLVILTDGRSITQRLKLKALGLLDLPVYISEEYGSEKPDDKRFRRVMVDFPASQYFYVGDNLKKDFFAPNSLGWVTICLRDDGRNIHPQIADGSDVVNNPDIWIDSLDELKMLEI